MRKLVLFSTAALTLACAAPDSDEPEMTLAVGLEPLDARIAAAPEVGAPFPDVTIVDDRGHPVNIRSLAGEKPYTVLTLGCLT